MRNAHDFGGELLSDDYIDRQWRKLKQINAEGIGVELKTENEHTVVVRVLDGGPAANSMQVSVDDRIVGVGNGDDGEIVDTVNLSLADVVDLIAGPAGTTVRLKIVSGDSPLESSGKVITVVRDKIRL